LATDRQVEVVLPESDGQTWSLGVDRPVPAREVEIRRYSRGGEIALALPVGTFQLRDFWANTIETNRLGGARAKGVEKLTSYTVDYGPGSTLANAPAESDLDLEQLRVGDAEAIRRVVEELGLADLEAADVVRRLEMWFLSEFDYTLDRGDPGNGGADASSILRDFLFDNRSGHCEYFATATTLLLRAAGVPARYVVGYSVQEQQGEIFVVRSRHGHAWTTAWVNGAWMTVDNTPARGSQVDAEQASSWEPIYDRLSAAWLAFTEWRQGESNWRRYVFGVGVLVLVFMGWRELRGTRWRRLNRGRTNGRDLQAGPGSDSEFYALVRALERRSAPREAAVPLGRWIGGIAVSDGELRAVLQRLLQLHYRLRFDPAGLAAADRETLRQEAAAWVVKAKRRPPIWEEGQEDKRTG